VVSPLVENTIAAVSRDSVSCGGDGGGSAVETECFGFALNFYYSVEWSGGSIDWRE